MAIQNLAAFTQFRRMYAATTTTANTSYSAPTNLSLLSVAGPDGSLITHLSSVPRATVTTTQLQFFLSKDAGTTYSLVTTSLMQGSTPTASSQITPVAVTQIDGSTISEVNPLPLGGVTDFSTSSPTYGGVTQGSANAQTLTFAAVTALTAKTIVDFEAGLTNTTTMTLAVGTSGAASVIRDSSGAALSAGDITAGFRYRVWCDGSFWRLMMTDRLYVGQGVTMATGIVTTVQQADF